MTQWSFMDHITAGMTKGRTGDPRPPTLWPSEASAVVDSKIYGQCRRRTFFRYMLDSYKFFDKYLMWKTLAEEIGRSVIPPNPYLVWIWKQGDLYEEFVSTQAKKDGVYIDDQVNVYIPEYNISGKQDLQIINPTTKRISICEVKSVYGFGGNQTLGTPSERKGGALGTPKDQNLMQIAIYDWWHASHDPAFEDSRLCYGSRDTGRYGEYLVDTLTNDQHPYGQIKYKPVGTIDWTISPITVNSILQEYKNIQTWVDTGVIPDRDYNLMYSEEELAAIAAEGELNKTEREKYEKVMARRVENEALIAEGKKPKVELKQIKKGNWQCSFCPFKNVCYGTDNQPRSL